jgi:hypothetical protein
MEEVDAILVKIDHLTVREAGVSGKPRRAFHL